MAFYQADGTGIHVDKFPQTCSRCNRHIAAIPRSCIAEGSSPSGACEVVFECPNCSRLMIALYKIAGPSSRPLLFDRCLPATPAIYSFPYVGLISGSFATLYNQAIAAEAYGLADIAGTGFRKALEFLVKDFCVARDPNAKEKIRKKFLKSVIDDHLAEGKLKQAATLTSWLGNDEGHYERRWIDTDLEDLKALLSLTIAFVNEEVQLEQYVRRMKPDEPQKLTFIGPE